MSSATTKVTQRLVVEGGSLREGQYWSPREVKVFNGDAYIALSATDRELVKFIGVGAGRGHPLAYNEYFVWLRNKRNQAVDDALLNYLHANAAFGGVRTLRTSRQQCRFSLSEWCGKEWVAR